MLEFLIDNIFVECGGVIFQQVIGIPMGTNCAPSLADLFLYSYEAEFIQTLIKSGKRHLAKSFNFTYRYIDDVLSINNPKFGDYIDFIYPVELEIKDTTDADHHASYLDLLLIYDNFHRLHATVIPQVPPWTMHHPRVCLDLSVLAKKDTPSHVYIQKFNEIKDQYSYLY